MRSSSTSELFTKRAMAGLPEGWEWDFDGKRWFYTYKPNGHVQYHFPTEGDEFPEFVDGTEGDGFPELVHTAGAESQPEREKLVRDRGKATEEVVSRPTDYAAHVDSGTPEMRQEKKGEDSQMKNSFPGDVNTATTSDRLDLRQQMAGPVPSWDDQSKDRMEAVTAPNGICMAVRDTAITETDKQRAEHHDPSLTSIAMEEAKTHQKFDQPVEAQRTTGKTRTWRLKEDENGENGIIAPKTRETESLPPTVTQDPMVQPLNTRERQQPPTPTRHELPVEFNPVGVIAEMPTEHTGRARIETHPSPVEIDGTMVASIERVEQLEKFKIARKPTNAFARKPTDPGYQAYGPVEATNQRVTMPMDGRRFSMQEPYMSSKNESSITPEIVPAALALPTRSRNHPPAGNLVDANKGLASAPSVLQPARQHRNSMPAKFAYDEASSIFTAQAVSLTKIPSVLQPARGRAPSQTSLIPQGQSDLPKNSHKRVVKEDRPPPHTESEVGETKYRHAKVPNGEFSIVSSPEKEDRGSMTQHQSRPTGVMPSVQTEQRPQPTEQRRNSVTPAHISNNRRPPSTSAAQTRQQNHLMEQAQPFQTVIPSQAPGLRRPVSTAAFVTPPGSSQAYSIVSMPTPPLSTPERSDKGTPSTFSPIEVSPLESGRGSQSSLQNPSLTEQAHRASSTSLGQAFHVVAHFTPSPDSQTLGSGVASPPPRQQGQHRSISGPAPMQANFGPQLYPVGTSSFTPSPSSSSGVASPPSRASGLRNSISGPSPAYGPPVPNKVPLSPVQGSYFPAQNGHDAQYQEASRRYSMPVSQPRNLVPSSQFHGSTVAPMVLSQHIQGRERSQSLYEQNVSMQREVLQSPGHGPGTPGALTRIEEHEETPAARRGSGRSKLGKRNSVSVSSSVHQSPKAQAPSIVSVSSTSPAPSVVSNLSGSGQPTSGQMQQQHPVHYGMAGNQSQWSYPQGSMAQPGPMPSQGQAPTQAINGLSTDISPVQIPPDRQQHGSLTSPQQPWTPQMTLPQMAASMMERARRVSLPVQATPNSTEKEKESKWSRWLKGSNSKLLQKSNPSPLQSSSAGQAPGNTQGPSPVLSSCIQTVIQQQGQSFTGQSQPRFQQQAQSDAQKYAQDMGHVGTAQGNDPPTGLPVRHSWAPTSHTSPAPNSHSRQTGDVPGETDARLSPAALFSKGWAS